MDEEKDHKKESFSTLAVALKGNKSLMEYLSDEDINDCNDKTEKLDKSPQINDYDNSTKRNTPNDSGTVDVITEKTCFQRFFGPIKGGSIRSSIFNLSILGLGSGLFALPHRMGEMSILACTVMVLLSGLASYWTMTLLIISTSKYNLFNYSQLVKHLYNKKLSVFLDLIILLFIFGVVTLYQIIVYQQIGSLVYTMFDSHEEYHTITEFLEKSYWNKYYIKAIIMYSLGAAIEFPLCIQENISKMWFTSTFGVLAMILNVIIITLESPFYIYNYWNTLYKENDEKTHLNIFNIAKGFDPQHFYFFLGSSTIMYAFGCHYGAFPIYKSLKNNVFRRIEKVIRRSLILDTVLFLIVGILGYLTHPINTPDLIIDRYKYFGSDWIMTFGKFVLVFGLLFKIPVSFNSFRISLVTLLFEDGELTRKRNLTITIVFLLVSILIGVLYSKISDYISLIGGLCGTMIAFGFPCMVYVKSNDYKITHWKNIFTLVVCSMLCCIGFIGAGFTVRNIINNVRGH